MTFTLPTTLTPNSTVVGGTNTSGRIITPGITHVFQTSLIFGAPAWMVVIGIFVLAGLAMILIFKYFKTKPKLRKIKSIEIYLKERDKSATALGGFKPKNAVWLDGSDVYRMYWYDDKYLVPEVQVPIEEPRAENSKKKRHVGAKQTQKKIATRPLVCWYMRVKPAKTTIQRMFPRFVPFVFVKVPEAKLDPHYSKSGELEYVESRVPMFYDRIGTSYVDRQYKAQLRLHDFDDAVWKPIHLGQLAQFADASQQSQIVVNPNHDQVLNVIERKGEADENVEISKKGRIFQ